MIKKINQHIGLKFFILLAIIIIVGVVPLGYTVKQAIKGYGHEIAEINEQQIRSQAFSFLRVITKERAIRYQAFFDRVAIAAGLLASHGSAIYSNKSGYAQHPLGDYHYTRQPHNGQWLSSIDDPVVSIYWGGAAISPDIKQDMQALTHMEPLFQRVLFENNEVLASHIITTSGIGLYCTDNLKNKEAVFHLPPVSLFDLRDGEPMTIFTQRDDPSRSVRWTSIYKDDVIDGLILTASGPIYDDNDVFLGVAGIDVALDTIIAEVLQYGENRGEDTILFSFLLDGDARVIALPDDYYPHLGLAVDFSRLKNSGDRLEVSLSDSKKFDVRSLAQAISRGDSREDTLFTQVTHEDETYYVVTSRMEGLGWFSGLVVRESDIMASVRKTRSVLTDTIRGLQLKGLLISLLIIFIAISIVFLAVKFLVMPLRALATATQRVAEGDLSVRCPVTTTDEAGVLAQSFNSMVEQLQVAKDQQEKYAEELEQTVVNRTHELIDQKGKLERTVELLNQEVEQRQIIAETLRESKQQYHDTMEASQAGVFIISDGLITYVNTSFADLFRMTRKEMIGTDPLAQVGQKDRMLVRENMARRYRGEEIPPYTISCIRCDDSSFFGEVWARMAIWQKKQVIVGTITDVSDIRSNKEKIELQDRQLRKSLDEKEVLLKEIHHRTKNNMMVVISMLDLQLADIEDEHARIIFQEMEDRIRAMALVHEKLYQSQNLSEIDFESYIREISESLVASMALDNRAGLQLAIEPMSINIDVAVPLGLVINEIVTNSVKHAFPGGRQGEIYIRLEKNSTGEIVLTVGDDGVGLPAEIDVMESSSFGMQIISSLVTMQLSAKLRVDRRNGTRYSIVFPEPEQSQRI